MLDKNKKTKTKAEIWAIEYAEKYQCVPCEALSGSVNEDSSHDPETVHVQVNEDAGLKIMKLGISDISLKYKEVVKLKEWLNKIY